MDALVSHWSALVVAPNGVSMDAADASASWALTPQAQGQAAGGWRLRVVNGSIWARKLFAHDYWLERTSVLRIVFEALRNSADDFNGVDMTYVHSDKDPAPPRTSSSAKSRSAAAARNLVIYTNAHATARDRASFPLPDYSFAGSSTSGQPWCTLHAELLASARAWPWDQREDRALFSGGRTSPGKKACAVRASLTLRVLTRKDYSSSPLIDSHLSFARRAT